MDDDDASSLSLLSLRRGGVQFDGTILALTDLLSTDDETKSLVRLCYQSFLSFGYKRLTERLANALPPPSDPSGRFRVATSYARALNGIASNSNDNDKDGRSKRLVVGFSHFLYPTEEGAREIVEFLCEMIPEEEKEKNYSSIDGTTSSSRFSAIERAVRVANGMKASSSSPYFLSEASLHNSSVRKRMREIVNTHARNVAIKQRMRDREGFSLTTNKDVAWTKDNGLWPEGPIDNKGVAVNISASKGIGGLVAAALRVAGGDRLSKNGSTNSQNIRNDDAEEQIEMQRLCTKIKSAAKAKKNREDSANETLEQRAQAREKDLEDLQTDMETTRHMMEAYVSRCEKAWEEMIKYAELQKEESAKFPELEEEYLIRKTATDMVVGPNASKEPPEKVKEELEKLIREDENRREDLQKEWDDARLPLENEIARKNAKAEAERTRAKKQIEDIQRWKEEAKEQVQLARQKAEERERLLRALERAPQGINRPSLVQKVTTIIKNIKKQDIEIAKIVRDARAAELQVAESAESLHRIYAVVEDAIFKAAKKDETMKMAYRYLHNMHKTFAKISQDVAEASESVRARGELEKQMDSLKELNMDSTQVSKDVAMLRKSVKKLEARVNV